jgi:hypothetical protein
MLLDDLMPRYDVVERHRTIIHASPTVVFGSIREADLANAPITRALLTLRAVPAAIARRCHRRFISQRPTRETGARWMEFQYHAATGR